MGQGQQTEKPTSVGLAVNVLWAAFALNLGRSAWFYFQMKGALPALLPAVPSARSVINETSLTISTLASNLIVGLLAIYVFDKVSDGKNWARVIVAVVFALSLIGTLMKIGFLLRNPLQPSLLGLGSTALSAYALRLLYTEPANSWFKRPAPPPAGSPWG